MAYKESEGEMILQQYLFLLSAPAHVREYEFARPRRWRFDVAWPEQKVAIEIEGGSWIRGRHTRGKGYSDDCEKYNEAAFKGWAVFRFTTSQLTPEALLRVVQFLGQR